MPDNTKKGEGIWKIQPLANYKAPEMATQVTLGIKLASMLKQILPSKPATIELSKKFESAPDQTLDQAAPRPTLQPFHQAVDLVVDEWLAHKEPLSKVLVFVTPPCDGFHLMEHWAKTRKAEVPPAPSLETILQNDSKVLPNVQEGDLLIIPRLDNWFRRHHSGLAIVRELIARLNNSQRRCILGVGSWAWTYLTAAADIAVELPAPLTLAPFDAPALSIWLSQLAHSGGKGRFTFHRQDNGEKLFDPADYWQKPVEEIDTPIDYLKKIAAASRGSPWLAWHIFRHHMRVTLEGEHSDNAKKAATASNEATAQKIVWIDSHGSLELPSLPKDVRASALMALHALLIHDQLSTKDLTFVLPPINTAHALHRLAADCIIQERHGKWSVRPAAYPSVRMALEHDGFTTDQL